MLKESINISCKNIFKHTDKDEIKKELADKWINIIKALEQFPQSE